MTEAPLQKITLNLYAADTDFLRQHYGLGWSVAIRELVQRHVVEKKRQQMRNTDVE